MLLNIDSESNIPISSKLNVEFRAQEQLRTVLLIEWKAAIYACLNKLQTTGNVAHRGAILSIVPLSIVTIVPLQTIDIIDRLSIVL
jgi:hypothetical protein